MSVPTPPEHHLTLNRLATIARLVAGAAHEVNNALQVIGGSAELLQNRTDLPEPVQKTLTRIRAPGRPRGVGDDRRRGAVAGAARRAPIRSICATWRRARSNCASTRSGAPTWRSSCTCRPTPQLVHGHRLHLLQAALNLIQNAEQALAPRRAGVIRVEVAEDGDHVALRVYRRRSRRARRRRRTHFPAVRHLAAASRVHRAGAAGRARDRRGASRLARPRTRRAGRVVPPPHSQSADQASSL